MKSCMPDLSTGSVGIGADGQPLSPSATSKSSTSKKAAVVESGPGKRLAKLIRILDSSKQQLLLWVQVFHSNYFTIILFFQVYI